jgi:hypothetical protein
MSEGRLIVEREDVRVMFVMFRRTSDKQEAITRTWAEVEDRDPSRPEIEFYRRNDLIDLLLPVT